MAGPPDLPNRAGCVQTAVAMALPTLVVTGSSGFLGRHLLDTHKERYRIVGLARRSQARSGAPVHSNIEWHQVDIGDREALERVFREIRERGGAQYLVHLAAHYDFTGVEHPEYWRTNVDGLRNVLDLSRNLGLRRFVFSSSVAACRMPGPGEVVDETTSAAGDHVYAKTKRMGEAMVQEYSDAFPSSIVRFAALFSDWCEYAPLFMFLSTWLSTAWNARVLGGRGRSAIPYLHVLDAVSFVDTVIRKAAALEPGSVLNASPDGAVSHAELFAAATAYQFGNARRPVFMPKFLCGPGMTARMLAGKLTGEVPFERPWMARYIDTSLTVDARRSRAILSWAPRERLEIVRRIPFLLENRRSDLEQWLRRNRAAMKQVEMRPNLKIHRLLEKHESGIVESFTQSTMAPNAPPELARYRGQSVEQQQWHHRLVLRQLMNAVRLRDRSGFMAYCRDLAEYRARQGFSADEVEHAFEELNRICILTLGFDDDSLDVRPYLDQEITTTLRFGCDQVQETYEMLEAVRG